MQLCVASIGFLDGQVRSDNETPVFGDFLR